MNSNAIDCGECQAVYGPLFMSFGDLHRKLIQAKAAYKFKPVEYDLLQAYISKISRPKYLSQVDEVLDHRLEFWADEIGVTEKQVSRAFKALEKLGVIITLKGRYNRMYRSFHPAFLTKLFSSFKVQLEKRKANSVKKAPVDNVDNLRSIQPARRLVIVPRDEEYSPVETNSIHPARGAASYIEDSLPVVPFLPPLPSSSLTPKTVDNFDEGIDEARRVYKISNDRGIDDSKAWVAKIIRNGIPLEVLRQFIKEVEAVNVKFANAANRDRTWALWREKTAAKFEAIGEGCL